MLMKGPGEGYHAAKAKALLLNPNLRCRVSYNGGTRHFRIFDNEQDIGCAALSSRDAWNKCLGRMERQADKPN